VPERRASRKGVHASRLYATYFYTMATKPACGTHKELGVVRSLRITQCPCGTIHLHLRSGVSLRLAAQEFGELADAVAAARRVLTAAGDPEAADDPRKPAVN